MSSNFDAVFQALEEHVAAIDCTNKTSTAGKKMADDVLDLMASEIQRRSVDKQGAADGTAWPDNAPSYRKKKEKGTKIVGFLTGDMLSDTGSKGQRDYDTAKAEMRYGSSEANYRKAQWFTRGSSENSPQDIEASGAKNQSPRPFYELDDEIRAKARESIEKAIEQHMLEFTQGSVI